MKKSYIGDENGTSRKAKKIYVGDENGIARRVKKIYIGDENGIARLCYSAETQNQKSAVATVSQEVETNGT